MSKATRKAPPGWKVRVGVMVGHGTFLGHFETPDGFKFTNDMLQCELKAGQTFRDLVVERAWECEAQFQQDKEKMKGATCGKPFAVMGVEYVNIYRPDGSKLRHHAFFSHQEALNFCESFTPETSTKP